MKYLIFFISVSGLKEIINSMHINLFMLFDIFGFSVTIDFFEWFLYWT
jgi:hypothetical protein